MSETAIATIEDNSLRSRIYTVRGVQVLLAHDLADLYHVSTSVFNQAVKRNEDRFPDNFRFRLTKDELQEVVTNCDNPDRLRFSPALPFAFTEQGVVLSLNDLGKRCFAFSILASDFYDISDIMARVP